jgi:hypothetical protein
LVQPLALVVASVIAAVVGSDYLASKRRKKALQSAFTSFHERIRHEQHGERGLLRDRRDVLEAKLREALPTELKPRTFVQGSYALLTGVKPRNGEFDIDVGLVLQCRRSYFKGPVEAKKQVRDALAVGGRKVRIRTSCVTVNYTKEGVGDYHVDIPVYVEEPDGRLFLAKGKEHSEQKYWEPAAPETLTEALNKKFSEPNVGQFRRCIRYLKHWRQVQFTTKAPYSIALTTAAYRWFEPHMEGLWDNVPNDLDALHALTGKLLQQFKDSKLVVRLPVTPESDLMDSMTPTQMARLREKLALLHEALGLARASQDPLSAVETLRRHFGSQFG